MTQFNQHYLYIIGFILGTLLLFMLPLWTTTLLLIPMILMVLFTWVNRHIESIKLTLQFISEFLAFSILVAIFVALTWGLNGLLS